MLFLKLRERSVCVPVRLTDIKAESSLILFHGMHMFRIGPLVPSGQASFYIIEH